MMIRRGIRERLGTLAPFLTWDPDAYMVIGDDGRLVWMVDGYTTSEAHPYSRPIRAEGAGEFNYIRNSIKATVDAYNGDVKLYVFDDQDPLILAYQHLFPGLLTPASEMPADMRRHARFPELLFRVQAEIYRTYHMRVPDSFYNRADLWDLATSTNGQNGTPQSVTPTYLVATLPGESQPEFLLTIPFTPHNKQNLIGLMVARCDGEHMGEIVFLQLPKQEIIKGPLQIEALINQNPSDLERPVVVEPAGLAGAARADSGASHRQHAAVCSARLHPGRAGSHAAARKGGAGIRRYAGLCRYLQGSAGAVGGAAGGSAGTVPRTDNHERVPRRSIARARHCWTGCPHRNDPEPSGALSDTLGARQMGGRGEGARGGGVAGEEVDRLSRPA